MKTLWAMVWKEWRESRGFLWIALVVFVGLPIVGGIEAMEQYAKHFEINASPWVIFLGGVLAVFVGVGITCRDFNGRLEDFWRSRPVSVTRWLLVKYFVGLAVVLAACVIPLAIELPFDRSKDAVFDIAWFPFLWAALYGIGFLAGCLVRRAGYAAMLGLAGMLLVYFLPVVLPPLQWMNVTKIADLTASPEEGLRLMGQGQIEFGAGMLGLAIMVLGLALLAVYRDWRIGFGRKMMYGSISTAVLILFGSAAFQLGTNMPILREIDLPKGESARHIYYSGNEGYVITERVDATYTEPQYNFRTIKLTESGIELGSPIHVTVPTYSSYNHLYAQLAPSDPRTFYQIDDIGDDSKTSGGLAAEAQGDEIPRKERKVILWLNVIQIDKGINKPVLHLWDFDFDSNSTEDRWPILYALGNRLYIIGTRLITMDISEPLAPRILSNVPFGYWIHQYTNLGPGTFGIILPPLPGLSGRERLRAVISPFEVFEGDTLCRMGQWNGPGEISYAYRLKQLTGTQAVFEKVGEREPTILENLFGGEGFSHMTLQNGLLYDTNEDSQMGNPHVDVSDTRGSHPLRMIGHFAAPGVTTVCPLPDGDALVGGDRKIWLVGPPPRRAGE